MLREMKQEMADASPSCDFEKAAALRDQIRAIERLDERALPSRRLAARDRDRLHRPRSRAPRASQKTLGLDEPIRCIEGIDIAHLQGGETVGSKVCFIDGRPFKDEYRRYRIKTSRTSRERRNDDYASIREVVSRRYREAGAGDELYPDVILIDGGLGQLHAALEAFETARREAADGHQPREEGRADLRAARSRADPLSRNNAGLRLCQQVRDEAHRFAQHYHHVLGGRGRRARRPRMAARRRLTHARPARRRRRPAGPAARGPRLADSPEPRAGAGLIRRRPPSAASAPRRASWRPRARPPPPSSRRRSRRASACAAGRGRPRRAPRRSRRTCPTADRR
jgi:excinuclease UvrABC nuclease subunit